MVHGRDYTTCIHFFFLIRLAASVNHVKKEKERVILNVFYSVHFKKKHFLIVIEALSMPIPS